MDEETPKNNVVPFRGPVVRYQEQESEPEKKERIPTWMAIAMTIVALLVDLLTLIPFVGWGVSAAAYVGFFVWFKLRGVVFTKNIKNFGAMGASAFIEAFLSFLPGFTAGIVAVIIFSRIEDKKKSGATKSTIL